MSQISRQIATERPAPGTVSPNALLDRAARLVTDTIEGTLHDAVERLERQLFACSDSGSPDRFAALDALRALGRVRAALLPECLTRIDAAVDACSAGKDGSLVSDGPWRLVDHADVDEAGLVAGLAATVEAPLHLPLHLLAARIAAMVQREELTRRELPLGPWSLLDALRGACVQLDMAPETRADLLRLFGQGLARQLPACYDAANAMLAREGVLPDLVFQRARLREGGAVTRQVSSTGANGTDASVADPGEPAPRSAHWLDLSADGNGQKADIEPESEQTLFALMRHLLGGRRALACTGPRATGATGVSGLSGAPTRATRSVTADELRQVLRDLQANASTAAPGSMAARLAPALQGLAGPDETTALDPMQHDTVDLVDLLFDHLARTVPPRGAVADLFVRLQAPMLRAALDDAAFFTRRQHPARRMLDALADAGLYWLDADVPADDPLLMQMRALVDTVATTYDGDHRVFDDATATMQQHLAERVRRSAIIERRHVEAERGRERLAFARDRAASAVRGAIGAAALPPSLHAFLVGAWTDVLALSVLRDSDDVFDARLQAVAELVACVQARAESSQLEQLSEADAALAPLRGTIERGLLRLGRASADAAEVATDVIRSAIDAGVRIDPRGAVPLDAAVPEAVAPDEVAACVTRVSDTACDPTVRQQLEQLRRLPFGTWFDVALNEGASRRCRMSWFSPVTGRCLFVNAHGQRVGDTTLPWLAAELVAGRACIVREAHASAIDSAWQAILGMLRSLGRNGAAMPA